jgi:hypothetical protein
MAYPHTRILLDNRRSELSEEEKDKTLKYHLYQGVLNDKGELETTTIDSFLSDRVKKTTQTRPLTEKQKKYLRERGYDV